MASKVEDGGVRKRIQRIEGLIKDIDSVPDPNIRAQIQEIIKAILDLHSTGFERIVEQLASAGEPGKAMIDSLADDDLVSSLLLLYGLHPLDFEARVQQALDKARAGLRLHGGNVELIGISDGIVRLRLQGSCHSCPSSAVTLKTMIEEAIYEKAPDVAGIEVEEAAILEEFTTTGRTRVALPRSRRRPLDRAGRGGSRRPMC